MKLFSWLRPATRTTSNPFRASLSLYQLESRDVPAAGPKVNPLANLPVAAQVSHGAETAAAHANPNALAHANANAAFNSVVTPPPVQTSTISGTVTLDDGVVRTPEFAVTVSLYLNGSLDPVQSVPMNPDGTYSFTFSVDQAASYTVQATKTDLGTEYLAAPVSGTVNPGQQIGGQDLLFQPNG